MPKPYLPKGYEAPAAANNFMKIETGPNRFRIMSEVLIGWKGWKDGKPFRRAGEEKNINDDEVDIDDKFGTGKPRVNPFWAFVVWDYNTKKIEILELTQVTIIRPLVEYINGDEWGDPREYDLEITKEDTKPVKYSVKPFPHKEVADAITDAFGDSELDVQDLLKDSSDDGFDDFAGHTKPAARRR